MSEASLPITPRPISADALALWDEIVRLDLAENIGELEVKGFTVVVPEKLAPLDFTRRMHDAILAAAKRRHGIEVSDEMTPETTPEALKSPFGMPLVYGLFEDEVFQQALLNPVVQTLATYMVGKNAVISEYGLLIKGPGGADLDLHADSFMMPDPLPAMPHICNLTWIMTDYSRENGAIAFVPGSHRYQRRPLANEGIAERVHVDAPAGSLIAFGGNVWHGSFARTAPGYRVSATAYLARPHMRTQATFGHEVPQQIIDRHPPEFARIMGRKLNYGWKEEGPRVIAEDVFETIDMGTHPWD